MGTFEGRRSPWSLENRHQGGSHLLPFTTDSVYFTEKEMVYHFDEAGKLVHGEYEISPCGSYPYTIKDDEIKIENQIFTITSTDSSYVFSNADWQLVLINK